MHAEHSPESLVHYLLARRLISPEEVMQGSVRVLPSGGLNAGFKVLRERLPGIFVKQMNPGAGDSRSYGTETAFFRAAASIAAIASVVPDLMAFDERQQILLLELIPASVERLALPVDGMSAFGAALGRFHAHSAELQALLGIKPPPFLHWTIQIHRRPLMRRQNRGHKDLYAMVLRHPELVERLGNLEPMWTNEGIIHGDIKWDNCVLQRMPDGASRLVMIDWESMRPGDFAWDVGGVLQDAWMRWIVSMPLGADAAPNPEAAAVPLADLRPALRAFWESYCSARGLDGRDAGKLLDRSVRFAAARLVQSASERSGSEGVAGYASLCMLQLADNVLQNPERARSHLAGL